MTRLDLFSFVPFRLNRLGAEVSAALSSEYRTRYGLDIPEWRVMATLGFRDEACSAQYISQCTRTHKSTISRAVTSLSDGRSSNGSRMPMTVSSACPPPRAALYEELIPPDSGGATKSGCLSPKRRNPVLGAIGTPDWCGPAGRCMKPRLLRPQADRGGPES